MKVNACLYICLVFVKWRDIRLLNIYIYINSFTIVKDFSFYIFIRIGLYIKIFVVCSNSKKYNWV